MPAHTTPTVTFEGSTPILPGVDLVRSLDYYGKTLGFTLGWHSPGIVALVSRGGCKVMLADVWRSASECPGYARVTYAVDRTPSGITVVHES